MNWTLPSVGRSAVASAFAWALALLWSAPVIAAVADADIPLKLAAKPDLAGLSVGLYAPDSTLKAPVETLTPTQAFAVTAIEATLNTNPGLCEEHTTAQILELPNQDSAAADNSDCVFGLLLVARTAERTFEIATECGEWVANEASCWGYGPTGDFRLVREADKAPTKFKLVFPGPASVPKPPAADADNTRQRHGLFLDTVLDDKKEAKGDLWLVWSKQSVELAFTR